MWGFGKRPKCAGNIHIFKHMLEREVKLQLLFPEPWFLTGKFVYLCNSMCPESSAVRKMICMTLLRCWRLTTAVAFDPQVSHAQAKDGQFVQTRANLLRERQEVCQPLQLSIQTIPVALRRVGFSDFIAIRRFLSMEETEGNLLWPSAGARTWTAMRNTMTWSGTSTEAISQ